MRILISNDDGIEANGIRVLSQALAREQEVYVVAPDRERSAAGHALTLHTPLRVEEVEPFDGVKKCWKTSGTPGDCIKIAVCAILEKNDQPDLIISGINHGPNFASDILSSGTVSCAMEGSMFGIPSIAVSLASLRFEEENFRFAAQFIVGLIKKLEKYKFEPKTVLNVNVPALSPDDIAGVAVVPLGDKTFTNTYEKRIDPRGKVYYWLAGELVNNPKEVDTDIAAVRSNKISITPISYDLTKRDLMPALDEILCGDGTCNW